MGLRQLLETRNDGRGESSMESLCIANGPMGEIERTRYDKYFRFSGHARLYIVTFLIVEIFAFGRCM